MAESWIDRVVKRFQSTFHPAHMLAGVCQSYTASQVADLLAHGASITSRASATAAFARYADVLGPGGAKLADAAGRLNKLAEGGAAVANDVKSACAISDAVSVLNKWTRPNSSISNDDAAKAFDQLFGGAATYFEKLPPPVNAYAQILSSVAEFNFFSNMRKKLDPEQRAAGGRQLREIMEGLEHP
jgi:hypothetical protein